MPRMPVVAVVTRDEFIRIHRRCQEQDVDWGGIYDASSGGAINVWGRDGWEKPDGHLHCTFYPERLDGKHPGEMLEELMRTPALLAVASEGRVGEGHLIQEGVLGLLTAGCEWLAVTYEPGTHGGEFGRFRADDPDRWGLDKDWTLDQAREHFKSLYAMVLGKPLPPWRIPSGATG